MSASLVAGSSRRANCPTRSQRSADCSQFEHMRITTPTFLLEDELRDIYDFEKRLVRAIPKMAKSATSEELRSGLMEHLEVTRNHVERIEQAFELLDIPARAKTCDGMKGIISEGEEMLGEDMEESMRDVAIAAAARRVEHYEMAAYATATAIAEHLENREVADLLQQNWDEEREADEKLGELAAQILEMSTVEAEESTTPRRTSRRSTRAPKTRRAGG
jgi:ferritin-like metal-binding protein YciE